MADRTIRTEHLGQQALESYLRGAANLLRGLIDAGDYKQYVFPLLFFKRLSDVWDEEYRSALDETGDEGYARATADDRFVIPAGAHWSDVRAAARDVGRRLRGAFRVIETANPERLAGVFGNAPWTDKAQMPDTTLKNLIEHFSKHTLSLAVVPEDELRRSLLQRRLQRRHLRARIQGLPPSAAGTPSVPLPNRRVFRSRDRNVGGLAVTPNELEESCVVRVRPSTHGGTVPDCLCLRGGSGGPRSGNENIPSGHERTKGPDLLSLPGRRHQRIASRYSDRPLTHIVGCCTPRQSLRSPTREDDVRDRPNRKPTSPVHP